MNSRSVIIFSLVLLFGIVCYKLVFVPTSMSLQSSPHDIFSVNTSPVKVKAMLTNRLGMQVPFEHLTGKFIINEGADKIDIVKTERDELIFKTKGSTGRLVILFFSNEIPFPVELVLDIRGAAIADLI